jgi:hypothetical protein
MPTPASGPISIDDVRGVFDGASNLAAYYNQLAFKEGAPFYLPASGPIALSDFYNLYFRSTRGVVTVGSSGSIRGYQSGVTGAWTTSEGTYTVTQLYYSTATLRTTVVFSAALGGAPTSIICSLNAVLPFSTLSRVNSTTFDIAGDVFNLSAEVGNQGGFDVYK